MRAPEFWSRHDILARGIATALSPIGSIYGATVAWKRDNARPYRPHARVICVGNLTAGGSGKTPVAIAIAGLLAGRDLQPFVLTRGYGGSAREPRLVDAKQDRAAEVGDEALLLAATAPTIIARNRKDGAQLADASGAGIIVMDDGHQNFDIAKDLSIVVVDGETLFGNGMVLPAGPLREPIKQGLARADAVIVVGGNSGRIAHFEGPILRAQILPSDDTSWTGKRVVAFAGIGRPEKFFATLKSLGAEIIAARSFPDHHRYAPAEIAALRVSAAQAQASLVTTEKDFVRLDPAERRDIRALPVRIQFANPQSLADLLDECMDADVAGRP